MPTSAVRRESRAFRHGAPPERVDEPLEHPHPELVLPLRAVPGGPARPAPARREVLRRHLDPVVDHVLRPRHQHAVKEP
eukprot:gene1-biopygen1331